MVKVVEAGFIAIPVSAVPTPAAIELKPAAVVAVSTPRVSVLVLGGRSVTTFTRLVNDARPKLLRRVFSCRKG